jgi:uncharacterized protein
MSKIEPFSGDEAFAAPPERVFAALLDPETLAKAIPDLVSSERLDERTLRCSVRPGFSFLRATMKMTIAITDVDEAQRAAAMLISSSGIGASMKVETRMRVQPEGDGSRVAWEARVLELGGLIAAVSPTLIRGAADKVVRDGWDAFRRCVEAM